LTLAILLLPLDVGVRRVSLYRSDLARALAEVRRRLGMSPRPVPALSGASTTDMAALFGARNRTREGYARQEGRQIDANRQGQLSSEVPNGSDSPWARDLQLSGRVAHSSAGSSQAETPVQTPPDDRPAAESEETSLAARLRKARDERQ